MAGGLAMRPMPKRTEAPQDEARGYISPEDELARKIAAQKAAVERQAGQGTMMERYRRLKMSDLPMPKKEGAQAGVEGAEELGTEAPSRNPAEYKVINSPTEGVFLQNPKSGDVIDLMTARGIPGFESLVEEGMLAGEALRKKAFK